jgi:5-amino-6-(5-phosphoribosylamino)uracil reductase
VLSAAVSVDGYLDDATDERLILSNEADWDRVDEVRAASDAILVGARTIRLDNPRLRVRSAQRRADRVTSGRPADPVKVTLTRGGDLDPGYQFFSTGDVEKLVYTATGAVAATRDRLSGVATVVDAGEPPDLVRVLADLAGRGIGRLMVEGGGGIHSRFLAAGLADELHLVIAPFFVGDARAPRFAQPGRYPWTPAHPARLAEVRQIGDLVLLKYSLSDGYEG